MPSSHRTCGFPASGAPGGLVTGLHRATSAELQIHEADVGQVSVKRDPVGRTKGPLAATSQVAGTAAHIMVQVTDNYMDDLLSDRRVNQALPGAPEAQRREKHIQPESAGPGRGS